MNTDAKVGLMNVPEIKDPDRVIPVAYADQDGMLEFKNFRIRGSYHGSAPGEPVDPELVKGPRQNDQQIRYAVAIVSAALVGLAVGLLMGSVL